MFTRSQARYTGQVPIIFTLERKERKRIIQEARERDRKTMGVGVGMEMGRMMTRSQTKAAIDRAAVRVAAVLYPLYDECARATTVEGRDTACIAVMDALLRSCRDIPFLIRFCAPFASTVKAKCREFIAEPLASAVLRARCARVLSSLV